MTTPSLVRIVYASRATGECLADLTPHLQQILSAAVRNNGPRGVTGLLIAHRGWFLQALEGPEAQVYPLFHHICIDPRHRDALLLSEGNTPAREFGKWSMCARQLSKTDALILGELDRRPNFEPADFPERLAMRLLRSVATVHERSLTAQVGAIASAPTGLQSAL